MLIHDPLRLANALLPAVLLAGRVEMRYFESDIEIERKADKSPVTKADREAEDILLKALEQVEPDIPVVAEEQFAAGSVPHIGSAFFLVDALDGTREFIKKRAEFTINIGLIVDGKPVFGMIYAPVLKQLFVTTHLDTAVEFDIEPDSKAQSLSSLSARKLQVREVKDEGLVAFASRSNRSEETEQFLSQHNVRETRQVGSSLKFCLIARGDANLYPRLGPTSEWDIAAGHAILEAAGGRVMGLDGQPLVYGKSEQKFLNPHFVAWGGIAAPISISM